MNELPDGPLTIQEAVEAQMQPEANDPPAAESATPRNEPDQTVVEEGAEAHPETEAEAEEAPEQLEAEATDTVDPEDPDEEAEHAEYEELGPQTVLYQDRKGEDVTLEEARHSNLRQDDYTRARQKVAADQKVMDGELEQVRSDRARYTQGLEQLEQRLSAEDGSEVNIDDLYDIDPGMARREERSRQARKDDLRVVQEERSRVATEQEAQNRQQFQSYIQTERSRLSAALPEWQDQEVAAREKAQITPYLQDKGYSPEEIGQLHDHRLVLMLREAIVGKHVETAKPEVVRKIAKVRPMMKKVGRRTRTTVQRDRVSQADKRLSQSGTFEDAIALQMENLKGST